MDINTALATLKDESKITDRKLVCEAATYLAEHLAEMTSRAVVSVTPAEAKDPAWFKVMAGSTSLCDCGDPNCENQLLRIIGPEPRLQVQDGATLIVKDGETIFVRPIGSTEPAASISVRNGEGRHPPVILLDRFGASPFQNVVPMEEAALQIGKAKPEERTFYGQGSDGFSLPMFRIDTIQTADISVEIVLDKEVERCELPTFEEGETIVLGPDTGHVYLKPIGAPEVACLRVSYVEAVPPAQLGMTDVPADAPPIYCAILGQHPLNHALLAHIVGALGTSFTAFPLEKMAEHTKQSAETRVDYMPNANGIRTPVSRLDAVDLEKHTVTITLDRRIERFTPSEEALNPPQEMLGGDGLQILAVGPDGQARQMSMDEFAAMLTGQRDAEVGGAPAAGEAAGGNDEVVELGDGYDELPRLPTGGIDRRKLH
jgi:hypothetical protein